MAESIGKYEVTHSYEKKIDTSAESLCPQDFRGCRRTREAGKSWAAGGDGTEVF